MRSRCHHGPELLTPAHLTYSLSTNNPRLRLRASLTAFARYSTEGPGNSLYYVEDGRAFSEAVVVASERLDGDAGWREVPDRHMLLVNSKSGAVLRPL